jgi:hypothetical protein
MYLSLAICSGIRWKEATPNLDVEQLNYIVTRVIRVVFFPARSKICPKGDKVCETRGILENKG